MNFDTTICAIATSPGNGAIAVIRMSGKEAVPIIAKVFKRKAGRNQDLKPYRIYFGEIYHGDELLDEVLVSIFKAPNSYTGEDAVEISCHGSTYIQQKILELLVQNGAEMAQPGEFTMRAFMNKKMDLSQAEAVADVIASRTKASHHMAMNQMRGGFSSQISKLRQQLLSFVSLIELELDFSEEDVEFADRDQLKKILKEVKILVDKLVESFELGNAIKHGVPIAIIGEPNVGKSTLLNILLNENKAIVSEIPGTTRDVIEDVININGILFRFIDTAGIRTTDDTIEKLGIERTYQKIKQAQIVLLLIDANHDAEMHKEKIEFVREAIHPQHQHLFILRNKVDMVSQSTSINQIDLLENESMLDISAKEQHNTAILVQQLSELITRDIANEEDVIISNARHFEALSKVKEGVHRIENGLLAGLSNDFLAQDVREVLHYLGEITGEITTDDILGNIFANFCIGK